MWASSFVYLVFCGFILAYQKEKTQQNFIDKLSEEENESYGQEVRIVGGRLATCEEFPHQVNFVVNNTYFCGGFIVHERFILTAAHCTQNVDPSTIVLRTGSSYRTNGSIVPIEEVISNPEYNEPPFDKDIAVLKTATPIEFNSCTQPIELPIRGFSPLAGSELTVSGWGRTRQGATTLPERLMAVNLTIVDRMLCTVAYMTTFTDNMFCAGNFLLGGKSACQYNIIFIETRVTQAVLVRWMAWPGELCLTGAAAAND
ncbi:PREDICTED: trypsin-2-like [Papilio xuthus]|uniref:Trypsin-2-like n=1 Tax=Papilio xuthus TaxID=66420 RepID=A0AAJ6YYM2_PAPXU|nr:PREDICTED: trypsin-2-like [Papilio xuthus]